jgi:hypothetical protein
MHIFVVVSGSGNMPHQAEILNDPENFGQIFNNQVNMSAKRISQVKDDF